MGATPDYYRGEKGTEKGQTQEFSFWKSIHKYRPEGKYNL